MSVKIRTRQARYQAGAGDGGGGTALYGGQSPAPHSEATYRAPGQAGNSAASPRGRCEAPPRNVPAMGPSGFLFDFRADREVESLRLLALAAASVLSEPAGCAVECAVSLASPGQTPLTSGTSDRATGLARWDQGDGDGPVSQAMTGRLAVIANDFSRDVRWPGYWRPLRDAGCRSVVSVPLLLEPGSCAALTVLAEKTSCFAPAVLADVVAVSKVAATSYLMAAEARAALAAAGHLRTAMQSRTSIDVACGVIMGQNRCSYEEAFAIIARASSHRNVKARVVAETILKDLPGGFPATHFKG